MKTGYRFYYIGTMLAAAEIGAAITYVLGWRSPVNIAVVGLTGVVGAGFILAGFVSIIFAVSGHSGNKP